MIDIRNKIYNHILTEITEKKLSPNTRIPTEKELAKKFKTNRMNAYLAIKMLQKEGVVRRNKRQGTIINENIPTNDILKLKNISSKRVHVLSSAFYHLFLHWNATMLVEFEKILNQYEYKVFHKQLSQHLTRDYFKEICSEIMDVGSSALIIVPDRVDSIFLKENLDLLYAYKGEIFLYDRKSILFDRWPFNSVCLDTFGEGVMVAHYLFEREHKNVVFLENENHTEYWIDERKKGLQIGFDLLSKGEIVPEVWSFPKDSMNIDVCNRIKTSKEKYVIVAPNDSYAVELIECAKENKLETPKDFFVISFDNNFEFYKYNLTTVAPPLDRIGKIFAELIYKKLNILDKKDKISIKVSSRIVERDTCK